MASYIEGNLSSGESIYYRAQVSWLSQIGRFALAIIFILIAMGAEEGVSIFFGIFAFFFTDKCCAKRDKYRNGYY